MVTIAELGTKRTLVLNGIVKVTVTVIPALSVYSLVAVVEFADDVVSPDGRVKPSGRVKLAEGVKFEGRVKLPVGIRAFVVCVVATGISDVSSTVTG